MATYDIKKNGSWSPKILESNDGASELAKVFLSNPSQDIDHGRVVSLLKELPHLAYAKFSTFARGDCMTPLHCMLSCYNAPRLEQLQAVHYLNPRAVLKRQGPAKRTALHLICEFDVYDPDIAGFIFLHNPSALTTKNAKGRTPLASLFQYLKCCPEKLPILKKLLELCPGALKKHLAGMDPFVYAVRRKWSSELLKVMAEHRTEHREALDLSDLGRFLSPEEVNIICNLILPKLKHLACAPVSFKSASMIKILDCAAKSQSLQSLSLHWLDSLGYASNHEQACDSLKVLLLQSRSLKYLKIEFSLRPTQRRQLGSDIVIGHSSSARKFFLGSLLRGLTCNQTLEELVLYGFNVPSFEGEYLSQLILGTTTSTSGLRKLMLERTSGGRPIPCLGDMLAMLPSVTELELSWETDEGKECPITTETLVQLLNKGRLKSLAVENRTLQFGRICESLRWDTSLKRITLLSRDPNAYIAYQDDLLRVLEESNTTLEEAKVYSPQRRDKGAWAEKKMRIYQYLNLNKYGRSLSRNPDTIVEDFVGALGRAANEDSLVLTKRNKFVLQYELLRESPGIWAQPNNHLCLGRHVVGESR